MNEITKYMAGNQEVSLSADTVKRYLVSGGGQASDQEVMLFVELCKYRGLNPFLREVYLIKYGNNSPAAMVVGKDAILKRALSNPSYGGHEAGITVLNRQEKVEQRAGSLLLPRENLVGGWCNVVKKTAAGNQIIHNEVSFSEYCVTKDGKPSAQWAVRPATMIRKVALAQSLREAFPEDVGGLYEAEELGIDEKNLDKEPVNLNNAIDITPKAVEQEKEPEKPKSYLESLLDLSDMDFLESNITVRGKTKQIKNISIETWRAIERHESTAPDLRRVSYRALGLLDSEPMLSQTDLFAGTPFPTGN
jgi:phage recombination protein Bet